MSDSTRACENCSMTVQYLGPAEVAARFGLAASTIRHYAAQGKMPEPDVRVGPTAGWSEATVDAWWASRPGRGARTDLVKK